MMQEGDMAINEMPPESAGEVEHLDVIIGGGPGGIVALK